jgi:hypothetical protein
MGGIPARTPQKEKGRSIDNREATTMTTLPNLDRFISLAQAARQLGLAKDTLRALIDSGKVKGAILPNGEIGVSERSAVRVAACEKINEQLRVIRIDDFRHLKRCAITIADASEKYDVPGTTLRDWIESGFVEVLEPGYGKKLNETDVAYCAAIHRVRKAGGILRVPLLKPDGTPYLLKHPELSEYRRKKKASPILGARSRP